MNVLLCIGTFNLCHCGDNCVYLLRHPVSRFELGIAKLEFTKTLPIHKSIYVSDCIINTDLGKIKVK